MSEPRTAIVAEIEWFNNLRGALIPCPVCGTAFARRASVCEATGEGKLVCSGCSTAYFTPPGVPVPGRELPTHDGL